MVECGSKFGKNQLRERVFNVKAMQDDSRVTLLPPAL